MDEKEVKREAQGMGIYQEGAAGSCSMYLLFSENALCVCCHSTSRCVHSFTSGRSKTRQSSDIGNLVMAALTAAKDKV
jgi:hypothetical protein